MKNKKNIGKNERKFFLIRHVNASSTGLNPFIGITDNEEKAKAMRTVFCDYEEIKYIK